MQEHLETQDLFKSASLLCSGARLSTTRHNGQSLLFVLSGDDLSQQDICYRTGKLKVNPLELKIHLNQLRDMIFGKQH